MRRGPCPWTRVGALSRTPAARPEQQCRLCAGGPIAHATERGRAAQGRHACRPAGPEANTGARPPPAEPQGRAWNFAASRLPSKLEATLPAVSTRTRSATAASDRLGAGAPSALLHSTATSAAPCSALSTSSAAPARPASCLQAGCPAGRAAARRAEHQNRRPAPARACPQRQARGDQRRHPPGLARQDGGHEAVLLRSRERRRPADRVEEGAEHALPAAVAHPQQVVVHLQRSRRHASGVRRGACCARASHAS
jgi:hypothetical protein